MYLATINKDVHMDNNFTILTVSMIFQHFYFRSYIQTITVVCINHDSQACRISAKKLTYQLSSTLNVHIDTSHSHMRDPAVLRFGKL